MKVIVILKNDDIPWKYDDADKVVVGAALEVTWFVDGKRYRRGVPMTDVKMYEIEES